MPRQNQTPLTSTELIEWITNAGRELDATPTNHRSIQTLINKAKAIGILAHTAIKIDALQVAKYKMGITSNEIDGQPKIIGTNKVQKDIKPR